MPGVIDTETLHVDELPGVWAPVQWDLTPEERIHEVETQAAASLLASVDIPEAILRLLLAETDIERCYEPPEGYDPAEQGEWDPEIITFAFKRAMKLESLHRDGNQLEAVYRFADRGTWRFVFEPERIWVERI